MSKIKHTIKPSNATAYSSNNPRTPFDQCAASTFSRNIPRMPFEQSAFEQSAFEQSANVHFLQFDESEIRGIHPLRILFDLLPLRSLMSPVLSSGLWKILSTWKSKKDSFKASENSLGRSPEKFRPGSVPAGTEK